MPSSKKYTLFSVSSAAPGEKPLCAFFQSEAGCRNGDSCKFSHGDASSKRDQSVEVTENSSVVSSESEAAHKHNNNDGNKKEKKEKNNSVDNLQHDNDPFADVPTPPPSLGNKNKNQGKDENSKSKKKKRKSADRDVFAGPKGNDPKIIPKPVEIETPHKKRKKSSDVKHVATSAQSTDLKSFVSSLPVANFTTKDTKDTPTPKKERENPASKRENTPSSSSSKSVTNDSKMEPHGGRTRISSPNVAKKWQKIVDATRQHERYNVAYDFARYKDIDEQNGIKAEWIKAKPFGKWCKSNPQAIAIDCEMCETQDPLSGAKNSKALCRLSVVDANNPDEVLLDTLVKPSWPVTDYRTRINGVTKEHLDSVEFTLRHAQAFMMALCSEETVILGHAVHNDLAAINMEHDVVADSSFLFRAKDSTHATVSLKDTVRAVMDVEMPETHDSVNDARKALGCILHWMKKDGKVELVERSSKQSNYKGHQLFVHRIPKQCKSEHLVNMFLRHTTIQPVEVDDIAFSGNTGKTHVSFKTPSHANLAFDSIDGNPEEELSGRLQKKVYLRNGDYVRVRKMVRVVKRPSFSNGESSKQESHPTPTSQRVPSPDLSGGVRDSSHQKGNSKQLSYAPFSFRDMEHSKPSWWKDE